MKKTTIGDYFITAEVVVIGLAEAAHLAAVFRHKSFHECAIIYACFMGIAAMAGAGFLLFGLYRHIIQTRSVKPRRKLDGVRLPDVLLHAIPLALMVSQLIFTCVGNTVWRGGDMTVETVGSFLATDSVYQVNPMTGQPYTAGMPLRLEILCLPTLYAFVCRYTGMSPAVLVYRVTPLVTLISCYTAFFLLGHCLFPEDTTAARESVQEKKRACFMAVVVLLLWVGTYRDGMDGFNVLYAGWRGVVIRNAVLLPWLFSLCLRKKWIPAVLCILAEACITWTLYGCGACVVVTLGMVAAQWYSGRGDKV